MASHHGSPVPSWISLVHGEEMLGGCLTAGLCCAPTLCMEMKTDGLWINHGLFLLYCVAESSEMISTRPRRPKLRWGDAVGGPRAAVKVGWRSLNLRLQPPGDSRADMRPYQKTSCYARVHK